MSIAEQRNILIFLSTRASPIRVDERKSRQGPDSPFFLSLLFLSNKGSSCHNGPINRRQSVSPLSAAASAPPSQSQSKSLSNGDLVQCGECSPVKTSVQFTFLLRL